MVFMAGNLTISHNSLYACLISLFNTSPFNILSLFSCLNNAINVVVTINVQPQKYRNPTDIKILKKDLFYKYVYNNSTDK